MAARAALVKPEPVDMVRVQVGQSITKFEPFLDWVREHGIEPTNTYELVVVDGLYIVAFQYDLDANGKKYFDRLRNEAAKRDPIAVKVKSPMPREGN